MGMKEPKDVIKGLEICRAHLEMGSGFCDRCPYFRECGCRFNMANDVYKLLKEWEAERHERPCDH